MWPSGLSQRPRSALAWREGQVAGWLGSKAIWPLAQLRGHLGRRRGHWALRLWQGSKAIGIWSVGLAQGSSGPVAWSKGHLIRWLGSGAIWSCGLVRRSFGPLACQPSGPFALWCWLNGRLALALGSKAIWVVARSKGQSARGVVQMPFVLLAWPRTHVALWIGA